MSQSATRMFLLTGGMRAHPAVEAWFEADAAPMRPLARRWFQKIRELGPDVLELLHDGHPTVCIGDIAFAYVNAFSAHVNIGFFFGSVLPDPARILLGSGKFMRHVKVETSPAALDGPLQALLNAAYADVHQRRRNEY